MSWKLTFQVVFEPEGTLYMGVPCSGQEPLYTFGDLGGLVEFLKEVGRTHGLGGLDEFAEAVKAEGKVMEKAVFRRQVGDHKAIAKAVSRAMLRRQTREKAKPAVEAG